MSSIHRETGEGYLSLPRTTNLCNRYSVSTAFTVYVGYFGFIKKRGSFSSVVFTQQFSTKQKTQYINQDTSGLGARNAEYWCNCNPSKRIARFFFVLKSCHNGAHSRLQRF